jgi:hypothetical protein
MHCKKKTKPDKTMNKTFPAASVHKTRICHGDGRSSWVTRITTATLVKVKDKAPMVNPINVSTDASATFELESVLAWWPPPTAMAAVTKATDK